MKYLIFIVQAFFLTSTLASEYQLVKSKYIGQENRSIKSLSPSDIKALKNGKGWGLAKAAELNGVPGPKHILEMKNEIKLSMNQIDKIKVLFNKMKRDAIPLGKKLIQLEKELNDSFANRVVNQYSLKEVLKRIVKVRMDLRFVHLNAHLSSLPVLSKKQLRSYNTLRGYNQGDLCKNVPKGHNPKMWKKHNGCN